MRPFAMSEPGPQPQGQFDSALEVLKAGVRERAFPGATFGVLYQGQVVALEAVGTFTYAPARSASPVSDGHAPLPLIESAVNQAPRSVTASTVYDLASVTKVVATTAAAMLLYDRGVLDLQRPVADILPGFVIGVEPTSPKNYVTLGMLLAHSSGLPGYAPLFREHTTPQGMLRACLRLPLYADPGRRAEYSDIGFILLGAALEVLSGEKLASFCAREIFEPLGMANTGYCPPPNLREHIPPTERDTTFRRCVIQGEVHDENCFALGGAAGHAGLFSNAGDILRFAGCILSGGQIPPRDPFASNYAVGDYAAADNSVGNYGTPLATPPEPVLRLQMFHPETIDLFATRQETPPGTSRALGWDTPTHPSSSGSFFSANSIGHLGYTGTSLWIDRERALAVVLLTNRTWPDRHRADHTGEAIRGVRPLFHDAIYRAL